MRHPSRPPIRLGVKTLDQSHQLRRLPIPEEPLDPWIRLDRVRLSLTIRIDQLHRHEVAVWHGVRVRHGEGIFQDGLDRTPDVDDLVSALQKLWRFVWEMEGDPVLGCLVGLVDVDALDGAAKGIAALGCVLGGSTDGMVEDEDSRRAGAVPV